MLKYNLLTFIRRVTALSVTFLFLICTSSVNITESHNQKISLIAGSFYASAIGDAMGRVTEFIQSVNKQFKQYPQGIRSFNDFTTRDWINIPKAFKQSRIAPYTDDTRMTLIVADVLINARNNNWDMQRTMSELAQAFVQDMRNPIYGWAAPFRAPGNAVLKAVRILEKTPPTIKSQNLDWWMAGDANAGGCGSVMRAFPFGIVFANDIEKAQSWAAQHSRLTHQHPMAVAACAGMAAATAQAIHGADIETIIKTMIDYAEKYDQKTARKIKQATGMAKESKQLLKQFDNDIYAALANTTYRAHHEKQTSIFLGWAADDALAATAYVISLFPNDIMSALYCAVHTPGDSDSIASMAGALVGARAGVTALPQDLINHIEDSDRIKQLSIGLSRLT